MTGLAFVHTLYSQPALPYEMPAHLKAACYVVNILPYPPAQKEPVMSCESCTNLYDQSAF